MSSSGYSGTPLTRKLGFKEGQSVLIINPPSHYYDLLDQLPELNYLGTPTPETADFIHLFCATIHELETHFETLKNALKKTGMFWISWPKGTSDIITDLNGNIVRRYGLLQGLVDVKVCAVDADWSGLKFMYRVKDRG